MTDKRRNKAAADLDVLSRKKEITPDSFDKQKPGTGRVRHKKDYAEYNVDLASGFTSELRRQLKEIKTIEADKLYIPLMNEIANKILSMGLVKAEESALLLADILIELEEGYPSSTPSERSKILNVCLKETLNALKSDIESRNSQQIEAPQKASAPYVPRKSGKASDFLKEHYGKYIEAGVCFRPDIKRLDPKLEQALTNEFRGRTEELRAVLPNRSDRTDARLAEAFGEPVRPEQRRSAISALSTAKRVKQHKL